MYKSNLNNIDLKLKELKELCHKKISIEIQQREELDLDDLEITDKQEKLDYKA